ncbi:hypothetical protein AK812_SmicGene47818, partial [Symbiodinium microadriaticum]
MKPRSPGPIFSTAVAAPTQAMPAADPAPMPWRPSWLTDE